MSENGKDFYKEAKVNMSTAYGVMCASIIKRKENYGKLIKESISGVKYYEQRCE